MAKSVFSRRFSWALRADVWAFIFAGLISGFASRALAQNSSSRGEIRAEFSRIGDASHFEFEGAGAERYKLQKETNGDVILRLPSLDESSLRRLKTMSDGQVKISKVDTQGADGMIEVRFSAGRGVDYFDYLSDQPTRLVLDFFPSEQAPKDAKPLAAADETETKLPEKKSGVTAGKPDKKTSRDPAGGDFVIVAKQGASRSLLLRKSPLEKILNAEFLMVAIPNFVASRLKITR